MLSRTAILVVILSTTLLTSCSTQKAPNIEQALNDIAETYVKLVLHLGQHDEEYVDAYYGPEEWQTEAESKTKSPESIKQDVIELVTRLESMQIDTDDDMLARRYQYLLAQTKSIAARVDVISGVEMTFDEESKSQFDIVAPQYPDSFFQERLEKLDHLLPGEGGIQQRFREFQDQFIVPTERLDAVFRAAVNKAREQTLLHMNLPNNESFSLEFVNDKPWQAYVKYEGDFHSLIQINTDKPIFINSVFWLAAHEGYPGHHVSALLKDEHLVKGKGWMEYSVLTFFSPHLLVEEGTATYSPYLALSFKERIKFEQEVLFPLAGLNPDMAEDYYKIMYLKDELDYAKLEAARRYLDGILTREETIDWLVLNGLVHNDRVSLSIDFFEAYGSYIVCYSQGFDLLRTYLQAKDIEANDETAIWREFEKIQSTPITPSLLK